MVRQKKPPRADKWGLVLAGQLDGCVALGKPIPFTRTQLPHSTLKAHWNITTVFVPSFVVYIVIDA